MADLSGLLSIILHSGHSLGLGTKVLLISDTDDLSLVYICRHLQFYVSGRIPSLNINSKSSSAYLDLSDEKVYSAMTICLRAYFRSIRDYTTLFWFRSSNVFKIEDYYWGFGIGQPRHTNKYLGKQVIFVFREGVKNWRNGSTKS